MRILRALCFVFILLAVAWSLTAVGSGMRFGESGYLGSYADMMLALYLNIAAAVGLVVLALTSLRTRRR